MICSASNPSMRLGKWLVPDPLGIHWSRARQKSVDTTALALFLPTEGELFRYDSGCITYTVKKTSDILTVPTLPGAISCICPRDRIVTSFKGMKLFDEAIVRLYLRASCNER